MTRKCHNRRTQANPWQDKEDPTEHRQSKEEIDTVEYHTRSKPPPPHTHTNGSIQLSIPQRDNHARLQKVLSEGVQTLTTFFLVDEGREDPNTTKSRQSSASQRDAIIMAFSWQADDGPPLSAGYAAL